LQTRRRIHVPVALYGNRRIGPGDSCGGGECPTSNALPAGPLKILMYRMENNARGVTSSDMYKTVALSRSQRDSRRSAARFFPRAQFAAPIINKQERPRASSVWAVDVDGDGVHLHSKNLAVRRPRETSIKYVSGLSPVENFSPEKSSSACHWYPA
jgi:hypothetical protein